MPPSKDRIQGNDTVDSAIIKLSDGNPGALSVLTTLVAQAQKTSALGDVTPLLQLDSNGIYGPQIWCLYKDVCGQNAKDCLGMLTAAQYGIVSSSDLHTAIDNRGAGLDTKAVLAELSARTSAGNPFKSAGLFPPPITELAASSPGAPIASGGGQKISR